MFLCNLHRSLFTAALPLLVNQLDITATQVGVLQSAMLVGYLAGQLPAGWLADHLGGERVLLVCLLVWSVSLAATSLATTVPQLLACRVLFGLASACAMPGVSAMAVAWVPHHVRAATVARVYLWFNLGGVLGLLVTPVLGLHLGWQGVLLAGGVLGAVWATSGWTLLPDQAESVSSRNVGSAPLVIAGQADRSLPAPQSAAPPKAGTAWRQKAVLCWVHGVAGFAFFIFSSWIPLILRSLGDGLTHSATGLLSCLPFLAAGLTGAAVGALSDSLIQQAGWPRLTVRRVMHAVSTLGCALCMLPLCTGLINSPAGAAACLVAFQACYGCSFGGFQAYVNDVGGAHAGKLIGLTNSCSIAMGIAGNLICGMVLQATGNYAATFTITVALYCTSFLAFLSLDGRPV